MGFGVVESSAPGATWATRPPSPSATMADGDAYGDDPAVVIVDGDEFDASPEDDAEFDAQWREAHADEGRPPEPRRANYRLTKDGVISSDIQAPMQYDGWDTYADGLQRYLDSGLVSNFVATTVIPYLASSGARIAPPGKWTREFYATGNMFYANMAVPAEHQLWMHANFRMTSTLVEMRGGFLALGKFVHGAPGVEPGTLCFGGTLEELQEWTSAWNRRAPGNAIRTVDPRKSADDDDQVLRSIATLGLEHYANDRLSVSDYVLLITDDGDGVGDWLLMQKRVGDTAASPHYYVTAVMCGALGVGIVAPAVRGSTFAQPHGAIGSFVQAVQFYDEFDSSPGNLPRDARPAINGALFFRAADTAGPAMVPYALCNGKTYYRLSRILEGVRTDDAYHGFARVATLFVSKSFWKSDRWKYAPPQAVLKAKGFFSMLPLIGERMNEEKLRGIVLFFNQRPGAMADVYRTKLCRWNSARFGPEGGAAIAYRPTQFLNGAKFLVELPDESSHPDDGPRVFERGDYMHTVIESAPTLRRPTAVKLATLTHADQLEAVQNMGEHTPTDEASPADYLNDAPGFQEVYYKQNVELPIVVRAKFRHNDVAAPDDVEQRVLDMAEILQAVSLAERTKAEKAAEKAAAKAAAVAAKAKEEADAERARKRDEDKERKQRAKDRNNELRKQVATRTDEERERALLRAAEAQKAEDERLAEVAQAERAKVAAQRADAGRNKTKLSQAEIFAKAKEEKRAREAALAAANPTAKGKGKGKARAPAAASNSGEAGPSGLPPVRQVVEDVFRDRAPPKKGKGGKPN
jgi:hypothetical protein